MKKLKDVKSKQVELNIFAIQRPMWIHLMYLMTYDTKLLSCKAMKGKYTNLPLLEFYKRYLNAEEFPSLRRHGLTYASVFETSDCCEQFFSKIAESLRKRLTNANLEKQLRVSTSSAPTDNTRIAREKQF